MGKFQFTVKRLRELIDTEDPDENEESELDKSRAAAKIIRDANPYNKSRHRKLLGILWKDLSEAEKYLRWSWNHDHPDVKKALEAKQKESDQSESIVGTKAPVKVTTKPEVIDRGALIRKHPYSLQIHQALTAKQARGEDLTPEEEILLPMYGDIAIGVEFALRKQPTTYNNLDENRAALGRLVRTQPDQVEQAGSTAFKEGERLLKNIRRQESDGRRIPREKGKRVMVVKTGGKDQGKPSGKPPKSPAKTKSPSKPPKPSGNPKPPKQSAKPKPPKSEPATKPKSKRWSLEEGEE